MVILFLTAHIHCLMQEYAHIVLASQNCNTRVSPGSRASGTQENYFQEIKMPLLKCKVSGGSSSLRKIA